jgi:dihydroorotate dehydrogenase electron transfer subunit
MSGIDFADPCEYRPGGRTRGTRVLAPFGRRAAPVTAHERLGAYVVLSCEDPERPRAEAGQFYMLTAGTRWGGGDAERPFLPRAFSVLRAPPALTRLDFLLEDVGPGTNRLCELDAGDELLLVGPLGAGFRPTREGRRPLLVGGGVGIAPLAIVESAGADSIGRARRVIAPPDSSPDTADPITLGTILPAAPKVLLGFRDAAHAEAAALFCDPQVATDDGSVGHHGLVTELLEAELDAGAQSEVYACGPPPMLEAVRVICADRGIPAQLALESGMACGFGACFGCVVPTRHGYIRLCVDGPVLDAGSLDTVLVGHGAGH